MAPGSPRIAVGIITMGRAPVLAETLRDLAAQTRRADRVMVCATQAADVPAVAADVEVSFAPPGTSLQRNRLIEAAANCDLLVFFDDDFLAEPGYLAATEAAFAADPSLVVSTGTVLADGINGPGITVAAAQAILAAAGPVVAGGARPAYNGYGCNMAVRLDVVRRHGARFDEAMRYYGWYEDIDFTRQVGRHGRIMTLPAARGVHLGVKAGRGSGVRLGYAQVMNPIHLARKGTLHWNRALRSLGRHIAKNLVRAAWPEAWIDRKGRLRGNLIALGDVLRGRVDPAGVGRL